jgi:hypothetical protein
MWLEKKRWRLCSCDHETLILSDDLCCCYVENVPTIYGAQKRFQIQWSSPAMLPACEGLYWWALNVNLSFQITDILGQWGWGGVGCYFMQGCIKLMQGFCLGRHWCRICSNSFQGESSDDFLHHPFIVWMFIAAKMRRFLIVIRGCTKGLWSIICFASDGFALQACFHRGTDVSWSPTRHTKVREER